MKYKIIKILEQQAKLTLRLFFDYCVATSKSYVGCVLKKAQPKLRIKTQPLIVTTQ